MACRNFAKWLIQISIGWTLCFLSVSAHAGLICRGSQMVQTCGNQKCEWWLGENSETCPADCANYLVASYNYQEICTTAKELAIPQNSAAFVSQAQSALAAGRQVRVVGRLHSTNSLICNNDLLISTQNMTRVFGLEDFHGATVVRAEAGVTMGQLSDWLHEQGMSLGYTLMGYRGISIAGAVGTGAHGSSPKHPSVLPTLLESVKILEADNRIVEYDRHTSSPQFWKALTTNLGMLGAILELRLRVRPQFALATQVDFLDETSLWAGEGSFSLVEDCDFGQIMWFPGAKKLMRMCGEERPVSEAQAGSRVALVDFEVSDWLFPLAKGFIHKGSCHSSLMCLFENFRVQNLQSEPPLKKLVNGREQATDFAVGYSHLMMASGMSAQGANFFQTDWGLAIPVRKLDQALLAMRRHFNEQRICLPFGGVFLRYGQVEDFSYLAHSGKRQDGIVGEPIAFLDIVVYNPVGLTDKQRQDFEYPYAELVRKLVRDHGARLHWGKNKDWAIFYEAIQGSDAPDLQEFMSVVRSQDPFGSFSNRTRRLLDAAQ